MDQVSRSEDAWESPSRRADSREMLLLDCCAALDHVRSALDQSTDRPLLRARLHDAVLSLGAALDEAAKPTGDRSFS